MKKLFLILLLLVPALVFSQTTDRTSATNYEKALEESNKLLQQALDKISTLEEENKTLKSEKLALAASLTEASLALKASNDILQKASDRISKDQVEIDNLRKNIQSLINAGVEIETYHWELMAFTGYPLRIGLMGAYNFHFYPKVGVNLGIDFDFETQKAGLMVGLKVNFK